MVHEDLSPADEGERAEDLRLDLDGDVEFLMLASEVGCLSMGADVGEPTCTTA